MKKRSNYFYDTNVLLDNPKVLDTNDIPYISSITLAELENIKTSATKDDVIKFKARQVLKRLEDNENYIIILYNDKWDKKIKKHHLPLTNDSRIIMSCYMTFRRNLSDITFVTRDKSCKLIATAMKLPVEEYKYCGDAPYHGYEEYICHSDEEVASFYADVIYRNINCLELLENEYLVIKDKNNKSLDAYKWVGKKYSSIPFQAINSKYFGKITARDIYQKMAIDSLNSNSITLLGGPAGSGKTMLALGYLFSELERGHIDRIVIFCNPVGARNAAKLGYYKGTVQEKVLSSQVGHVLTSKLGSITEVETLLDNGTLQIIPIVDARGYEVPEHSGVYVLEAQNLTSDLLRMVLQRVGKDNKVIVDGDRLEQLDMSIYASDNGMEKMSKVFKGHEHFGQVDLRNIYRSWIADLAQRMK